MSENGNEHNYPQIDIERIGPGPEVIDEVSQARVLRRDGGRRILGPCGQGPPERLHIEQAMG